jgi:26S proteasome regulatory subunit N2
MRQQDILSQALRASSGGDLRALGELNEIFGRARTRPETNEAPGAGAAAAAGVLTAVDEDGENDEEAPAPHEFEYFTDGDDED